MKKTILVLLIILTITSCNNDDDNSGENKSELIIGLWNLNTINGEPLSSFEPIRTQYEFSSNGDFKIYTNGTNTEQSTWDLNSNNTKVTFFDDSFNILNLTNNIMKLSLPYSDPSLTIIYEFTKEE